MSTSNCQRFLRSNQQETELGHPFFANTSTPIIENQFCLLKKCSAADKITEENILIQDQVKIAEEMDISLKNTLPNSDMAPSQQNNESSSSIKKEDDINTQNMRFLSLNNSVDKFYEIRVDDQINYANSQDFHSEIKLSSKQVTPTYTPRFNLFPLDLLHQSNDLTSLQRLCKKESNCQSQESFCYKSRQDKFNPAEYCQSNQIISMQKYSQLTQLCESQQNNRSLHDDQYDNSQIYYNPNLNYIYNSHYNNIMNHHNQYDHFNISPYDLQNKMNYPHSSNQQMNSNHLPKRKRVHGLLGVYGAVYTNANKKLQQPQSKQQQYNQQFVGMGSQPNRDNKQTLLMQMQLQLRGDTAQLQIKHQQREKEKKNYNSGKGRRAQSQQVCYTEPGQSDMQMPSKDSSSLEQRGAIIMNEEEQGKKDKRMIHLKKNRMNTVSDPNRVYISQAGRTGDQSIEAQEKSYLRFTMCENKQNKEANHDNNFYLAEQSNKQRLISNCKRNIENYAKPFANQIDSLRHRNILKQQVIGSQLQVRNEPSNKFHQQRATSNDAMVPLKNECLNKNQSLLQVNSINSLYSKLSENSVCSGNENMVSSENTHPQFLNNKLYDDNNMLCNVKGISQTIQNDDALFVNIYNIPKKPNTSAYHRIVKPTTQKRQSVRARSQDNRKIDGGVGGTREGVGGSVSPQGHTFQSQLVKLQQTIPCNLTPNSQLNQLCKTEGDDSSLPRFLHSSFQKESQCTKANNREDEKFNFQIRGGSAPQGKRFKSSSCQINVPLISGVAGKKDFVKMNVPQTQPERINLEAPNQYRQIMNSQGSTELPQEMMMPLDMGKLQNKLSVKLQMKERSQDNSISEELSIEDKTRSVFRANKLLSANAIRNKERLNMTHTVPFIDQNQFQQRQVLTNSTNNSSVPPPHGTNQLKKRAKITGNISNVYVPSKKQVANHFPGIPSNSYLYDRCMKTEPQ